MQLVPHHDADLAFAPRLRDGNFIPMPLQMHVGRATLNLAQGNGPGRVATVAVEYRVLRILPALIGKAAAGLPEIFHKTVCPSDVSVISM